jgi:hypothetical protein
MTVPGSVDRPGEAAGGSRYEALEWLARRLYMKFEHIDPTGESWEDIDERR